MAGFLYFLPAEKSQPDPARLNELGLGYLWSAADHSAISSRACSGGPNGEPGLIVAVHPAKADLGSIGYYPNKQTWTRWNNFHLSWDKNSPPQPTDLARLEITPGHEIIMANGQTFRVPAVRFLPNKLIINQAGELERQPLEKFIQLGDLHKRCWNDVLCQMNPPVEVPEGHEPLTEIEQIQLATQLLQINYRLSTPEINLLGLFSDTSLVKTLEAGMDIPTLVEISKREREVLESKKKQDQG